MKDMVRALLGRGGRATSELLRVARRFDTSDYDANAPRSIAGAVLFEVGRLRHRLNITEETLGTIREQRAADAQKAEQQLSDLERNNQRLREELGQSRREAEELRRHMNRRYIDSPRVYPTAGNMGLRILATGRQEQTFSENPLWVGRTPHDPARSVTLFDGDEALAIAQTGPDLHDFVQGMAAGYRRWCEALAIALGDDSVEVGKRRRTVLKSEARKAQEERVSLKVDLKQALKLVEEQRCIAETDAKRADRFRDEAAELRAWILDLAGLSECQVDDETWRGAVAAVLKAEQQPTDDTAARMTAASLGVKLTYSARGAEVTVGPVTFFCKPDMVLGVLKGIELQRRADGDGSTGVARATLEGIGYKVKQHSPAAGRETEVRVINPVTNAELVVRPHQLRLVSMGAQMHAKSVRSNLERLHEAVGGDPDSRSDQNVFDLSCETIEEGSKGRIAWEILSAFVSEHLDPKADDLMLDLTVQESRERLEEMLRSLRADIRVREVIRMEMNQQGLAPLMCVLCGGWVDHDEAVHHGLGPQPPSGECPPGSGPAHRGCEHPLEHQQQTRRIEELKAELAEVQRTSAKKTVAEGVLRDLRQLALDVIGDDLAPTLFEHKPSTTIHTKRADTLLVEALTLEIKKLMSFTAGFRTLARMTLGDDIQGRPVGDCSALELIDAVRQHIGEQVGARETALTERSEIIAEMESDAEHLSKALIVLGNNLDCDRQPGEGAVNYALRLADEAKSLSEAADKQSHIIDRLAAAAGVQQRVDEAYEDYIDRARGEVNHGADALRGLADIEDAIGVHVAPNAPVAARAAALLRAVSGMVHISDLSPMAGIWLGDDEGPQDYLARLKWQCEHLEGLLRADAAGGQIWEPSTGNAPSEVEPWSALAVYVGKHHGGGFKLFQACFSGRPHWRCSGMDSIAPGGELDHPFFYLRAPSEPEARPAPEDEERIRLEVEGRGGEHGALCLPREHLADYQPLNLGPQHASAADEQAFAESRALGLKPVGPGVHFQPVTSEDFNRFRPPLMRIADHQPEASRLWEQQEGESLSDFAARAGFHIPAATVHSPEEGHIYVDVDQSEGGRDPNLNLRVYATGGDVVHTIEASEPVTLLGDSIAARLMRAMYAIPALLKLTRDTARDEQRSIPATWGMHGRRQSVEVAAGGHGTAVTAVYETHTVGVGQLKLEISRGPGAVREPGLRIPAILRLWSPKLELHGHGDGPGWKSVLLRDADDHDEVRAAVRRLTGVDGAQPAEPTQ